MFPTAPSLALVSVALVVAALSSFGLSMIWNVFAVTLVVTTLVAVHRSIPRKER